MRRSASCSRLISTAASALIAGAAVVGLAAPAAMAGEAKPAKLVCEGQTFAQQFLESGDHRYYTPMPGGLFEAATTEGWTFSGGAEVLEAVLPDGSTGPVLNLPAGSRAVSAPMCVTLAYPVARGWANGTGGGHGIAVSVSYAGTQSAEVPEEVGKIEGKGRWYAARFDVSPGLGGAEEAPREVRFVFEGRKGVNQLYGLYVDPRMSR
jgi:hypothetical protein